MDYKAQLEKLFPYLKNKYVVVILIMLIWLLFFDRNNLIYRYKAEGQLQRLMQEKSYYKERINKIEARKNELLFDENALEKFAREKYLMKKDDEDLYIIVE